MRPSLYAKFVDKAEAALVAAVEVYNKPSFRYREETFALLAINAWELLLKARLLREAGNDPKAIRVYENRRTKAGRPSKKQYLKKTRAGHPMTYSLAACVSRLDANAATRLSPEIKANLDALVAIRDGAAHYIHASPLLARQVMEIGSAAVKNFIISAKKWFGRDLSDSLSLVLPLSFLTGDKPIDAVVVTPGEKRLIKYLQGLAETEPQAGSLYSVAVRLQVKFERSKLPTVTQVQVTTDPDAVKVVLTEEDMREKFPWDYKTLLKKCGERYSDFKQDKKFHELRKPLVAEGKLVHARYLDPGNPRSGRKDFYSGGILDVFDAHYTRKKR